MLEELITVLELFEFVTNELQCEFTYLIIYLIIDY